MLQTADRGASEHLADVEKVLKKLETERQGLTKLIRASEETLARPDIAVSKRVQAQAELSTAKGMLTTVETALVECEARVAGLKRELRREEVLEELRTLAGEENQDAEALVPLIEEASAALERLREHANGFCSRHDDRRKQYLVLVGELEPSMLKWAYSDTGEKIIYLGHQYDYGPGQRLIEEIGTDTTMLRTEPDLLGLRLHDKPLRNVLPQPETYGAQVWKLMLERNEPA